jgi:hypothetical protein
MTQTLYAHMNKIKIKKKKTRKTQTKKQKNMAGHSFYQHLNG